MIDLLTTPQVAELLGVSRGTIWWQWKRGYLKERQMIGGPVRPQPLFDRRDVEAFAVTYTGRRGPRSNKAA